MTSTTPTVEDLLDEILDLRETITHLEYELNHDAMTGALNRRGLHAKWRNAYVTNVVSVVDVDGLKTVNDQHGHAAGDALIVTVAGTLMALYGADNVARIGGDEFVVFGEVTSFSGSNYSSGYVYGGQHANLDDAINAADKRMYENKRARRVQR